MMHDDHAVFHAEDTESAINTAYPRQFAAIDNITNDEASLWHGALPVSKQVYLMRLTIHSANINIPASIRMLVQA